MRITRPTVALTVAQTQRLGDCLRVASYSDENTEGEGIVIVGLERGAIEVRVPHSGQIWTIGRRGGLH